jgi:trimeric autotransporter adhesin
MKKNGLLFVFSLLILSIQAQTLGTCAILKDINPGTGSSLPTFKTPFKNKVFFVANNGTTLNGSEIWSTDGTTAGTVMVKDIYPGPTNSAPNSFTPINANTMIFSATTALEGAELWKTDGTEAGTVMVKDILLGSTGSTIASMIAYKGKAYFRATQSTAIGSELWVSDGTDTGTVMLKDISATGSSTPVNMTIFKDKLYFSATDTASSGTELWVTDGTAAGTVLVKDINPGKANSSPTLLRVAGNFLYFRATDSISGIELWRTDGTAAGTVLVKDVFTGRDATAKFNNSSPSPAIEFGTKLVFTATDTSGTELWITDGTDAGTKLIKDICTTGTGSSAPTGMFAWKNKVYFRATDCVLGSELWETDGTAANTKMVVDINSTGDASVANLQSYGGKLYFNASDGVNGFELWETDGTAANTKMACDLRQGSAGGGPSLIDVYFSGLLFSAVFDSTGTTNATGTELGFYRTAAGVSTKEAATFALSVKPTVAIDAVTIDVLSEKSGKANVYITDLLGHQFATKTMSLTEGPNFETVDVSKLPNGFYFLTLTMGDERQTKKFVKQ